MANVVTDWVRIPDTKLTRKEKKAYQKLLQARVEKKLAEDGDLGPRAEHIPEIIEDRYYRRCTESQSVLNSERIWESRWRELFKDD